MIIYKAGKTLPNHKKKNKITIKQKNKTKQLHQQQIKNAVDVKHQMRVILML